MVEHRASWLIICNTLASDTHVCWRECLKRVGDTISVSREGTSQLIESRRSVAKDSCLSHFQFLIESQFTFPLKGDASADLSFVQSC